MDFKPTILDNFARFRGIINAPDRVEGINNLLNEINSKGFNRLVDIFCAQKDSDKAYDIIFEIWICRILLQNPEIQNLEYEPSNENSPPDFRFQLRGVQFDIQVKRLLNVHNEMTKGIFYDECLRRLERISKPWFINYGVSSKFVRQDINPFFEYIKKYLDSFEVVSSLDKVPISPMYSWPDKDNALVSFTFSEKQKKENKFISPGIVYDDAGEVGVSFVDMAPIRKATKRVLNKAKTTLRKKVTAKQSNLVIIKTGGDIWLDTEDVLNILYGDEGFEVSTKFDGKENTRITRASNGLFSNGSFSTICGVVFIAQNTNILSADIEGSYFLNPLHIQNIKNHPKPFPNLPFTYPSTWKDN